MLTGKKISGGIAISKACVIKEEKIRFDKFSRLTNHDEIIRLRNAIAKFEKNIADTIKQIKSGEADILETHILIAQEISTEIENEIENNNDNITAEYAANKIFNSYIDHFKKLNDDVISQRVHDFVDIKTCLLKILRNIQSQKINDIDDECIIIKKEFIPSELFSLDKNKIKGLISETQNPSSHAAIIAKSLEIPSLFNVDSATSKINNGDKIILDADNEKIFVNPTSDIIAQAQKNLLAIENEKKFLAEYKNKSAYTKDGKRINILANINYLSEIDLAIEKGIDGIGLFRSEFLFMERNNLPSEQKQFEIYKTAAQKMNGKPVTIRTLDIGADKKIPYLNLEHEDNSFLGYRAIRFCLDNKNIFHAQIKAILRASAYGKIKLMVPMISTFEELIETKKIIYDIKTELDNENVNYDKNMQVGIMIETPSAVLMADDLAKECDFFSIGTNDLIQYTMTTARDNTNVAHLYSPYQPAVIKNIMTTIDAAKKNNIEISICGEAASNPLLIPLFICAGLKNLSMPHSSILATKQLIAKINCDESKHICDDILKLKLKSQIKNYLTDFNNSLE